MFSTKRQLAAVFHVSGLSLALFVSAAPALAQGNGGGRNGGHSLAGTTVPVGYGQRLLPASKIEKAIQECAAETLMPMVRILYGFTEPYVERIDPHSFRLVQDLTQDLSYSYHNALGSFRVGWIHFRDRQNKRAGADLSFEARHMDIPPIVVSALDIPKFRPTFQVRLEIPKGRGLVREGTVARYDLGKDTFPYVTYMTHPVVVDKDAAGTPRKVETVASEVKIHYPTDYGKPVTMRQLPYLTESELILNSETYGTCLVSKIQE